MPPPTEPWRQGPWAGKRNTVSKEPLAAVADPARLEALRHLDLLDRPADKAFDRLAGLAAGILRAPVALVSLVDEGRQFFLSCPGLPEPWASRRETPLSHSFCQHVVARREPLVIADARAHPLVRDNRAVAELGVVAYLGIPLVTSAGHVLGSFCVIDTRPREWTAEDQDTLRELAASVMTEIELRAEVAERRRAEAALGESQRFLRSTLDALSAHVAILDESGSILAVNAAWRAFAEANRLPGATAALGENYLEACDRASGDWGEEAPAAARGIREVLAHRRDDFDLEYPCHSPTERRWFLMRVTRFPGGGPARAVVAHENITARKEAEEALRQARDELDLRVRERTADLARANEGLRSQAEKLQEQAHILDLAPVLVRDLEGRIVLWNQGAARMYGWPPEEALGRVSHTLLQTQFPRPLEQIEAELMHRGQWEGELTHTRKDGSRIVVASHWVLHRDAEGRPSAILAVNTDVTEKKQLEAQYLRAQRMEGLGTLAGGIAHDLNNVLTPVVMAADLLRMQLRDPALRPLLETLQSSAARGADMVRQILLFARGAEGDHAPLQLRHVLADVEKMLRHTLPKSIEVESDVPRDLAAVSGDATQLHQVFLNLCVNARDALPQGGRLTLTAEETDLDEAYARMETQARPGRYVLVRVADTGTGIPPDILDKIFDPFFTTKEQGKGTGLGLATVLGIVRGHGGFVNVRSEVGKGTQFSVYLPVAPTGVACAPAPREVLPCGSGELVLVVDDEAAIREITRTTLEANGYRVLTAGDGTEALALFAQHRPDIRLVLTDMMMPVMDGPATVRALRKLAPQVRVVAMSGLAAGTSTPAAGGVDALAVLQKPYTAADLLRTLREALRAT